MVSPPGVVEGASAADFWQHDELPGRGQRGNRNLDQAGAVTAPERAFEGGPQLGRVTGALGRRPEALGEAHEIRVAEVAGDDPVAEAFLLVAPHIAKGAIVEDH